MMHENGALAAVPLYGPDGVAHRWSNEDLRSYVAMFD